MCERNSEIDLVYSGDFCRPEVAEEWKKARNFPLGKWSYHNHGGRDEDIFYHFDPEISLEQKDSDFDIRRDASIISPPIQLKVGIQYILSYEIKLFGIKFPAETKLIIWKDNGDDKVPEDEDITVLKHAVWPLDQFQWPVGDVRFSVAETGLFRYALRICNAVAVNIY